MDDNIYSSTDLGHGLWGGDRSISGQLAGWDAFELPPEETLQAWQGDELQLAVKAVAGATELDGHGEVSWSVTGNAVALVPIGSTGSCRLRAERVGTSQIKVRDLGLERALTMEVVP